MEFIKNYLTLSIVQVRTNLILVFLTLEVASKSLNKKFASIWDYILLEINLIKILQMLNAICFYCTRVSRVKLVSKFDKDSHSNLVALFEKIYYKCSDSRKLFFRVRDDNKKASPLAPLKTFQITTSKETKKKKMLYVIFAKMLTAHRQKIEEKRAIMRIF